MSADRIDSIAAYTFQADIFCSECIVGEITDVHGEDVNPCVRDHEDVEGVLDCIAREMSINRMDESSFDSDDFPKVIFSEDVSIGDICSGCWEVI